MNASETGGPEELTASWGARSRRTFRLLTAVLALWAGELRADYTAVLLNDGGSTKTVKAGETFELDVVVTSDAADRHDSAEMVILFSSSGIEIRDIRWSDPYVTGGEDDASLPGRSTLPRVATADLVRGNALPEDSVDLYLSNLIGGTDTFGVGRVVRLTLAVPTDYLGPELVSISVAEAGFASGARAIPAQSGLAFRLRIEPVSGSALPSLSISRSGGTHTLSWPAALRNVGLETTGDPVFGEWVSMGATPETVDGRNVVILPDSGGEPTFYRLRFR